MQYLNLERMRQIDPQAFRERRPFPWVSVRGFVNDDGFRRLCNTLPDINTFARLSTRKGGYVYLHALLCRPGL